MCEDRFPGGCRVKRHSGSGVCEQIDGVGPFLHRDDHALVVFLDQQRDVFARLRRDVLEFVADRLEHFQPVALSMPDLEKPCGRRVFLVLDGDVARRDERLEIVVDGTDGHIERSANSETRPLPFSASSSTILNARSTDRFDVPVIT